MNYHYLKYSLMILMIFSWLTSLFGQPISNVRHPGWVKDKIIYEVNLRQFTESGSIKEFRKHLPRLKELGVGILWLMPIYPIGEINRKGSLGSYYAVKDYKAIDPNYGNKDEFRELVMEVHSMGMYLILDWVANHTAWDNELTKTNPEFYTKDSLGNFIPPVPDWSDVIDLNYDNKNLWDCMAGALEYWVKEFDIDGYRCDVAGMVPTDFWDYATARLRKIKNVFMLAEWESPEMHLNSFNMTYAWDMHHLLNKISKGESGPAEIIKMVKKDKNTYPSDAIRMQFITNHDENSWNGTEFERLGESVKAMAVLTFTLPGMPLIYTGQEIGLNKRLSFFEKDPVVWHESEYTPFYQKLCRLKNENSVLHNGDSGGSFREISNSKPEHVLSFSREGKNGQVVVIANLSDKKAEFEIKEKLKGNFRDYFNSNKKTFQKIEKITLSPWAYEIYIKSE